MIRVDAVIAVCHDHYAADAAVKELTEAGFEMRNRSIVEHGLRGQEVVCASVLHPGGASVRWTGIELSRKPHPSASLQS